MVWPRSCSVCSEVSVDHCEGMQSMPTPHALGLSSPEMDSSSSCTHHWIVQDTFPARAFPCEALLELVHKRCTV